MTAEQCECGTWVAGVVGSDEPMECDPPRDGVIDIHLVPHTADRCRAYQAANGQGSRG